MPWSHIFKHDAPKDAPHNNGCKKCRVAAITDQLRKIKAIGCRAISHKRSADNKSGTCSRARSITNQAKQPDAANRSRNLLLWRRRRLLVAQASSSSLQLRPQPAARKSFHMPCDQKSCPVTKSHALPSFSAPSLHFAPLPPHLAMGLEIYCILAIIGNLMPFLRHRYAKHGKPSNNRSQCTDKSRIDIPATRRQNKASEHQR